MFFKKLKIRCVLFPPKICKYLIAFSVLQEEYLGFVARLILHVREMSK